MNTWKEEHNTLTKTVEHADFKEALAFVNRIGDIAESMNHHPDIRLHGYKYVTITLQTHSENSVTEKDHALAKAIDAL